MAIRVVCAIVSRDGLFLAARRATGRSRAGLWEFPGGKVEAGEGPREALAREMAEEFGCASRVGAFLASSTHGYGDMDIVLDAYRVDLEGPLRLLVDHDALAWMDIDGLRSLDFAPADLPILETLEAEG